MARRVVGIVRGGVSNEYALSLKAGAELLRALPEESYDARDIFVDRKGVWHARGIPADPFRALGGVDVVLHTLHRAADEDRETQRFLERSGVPFAGSFAEHGHRATRTPLSRTALRAAGIPVPGTFFFTREHAGDTAQAAREIFSAFSPPYIVRAPRGVAVHGSRIARSLDVLPRILHEVLLAYGEALVEEYLLGTHIATIVFEDFRGQGLYTFPVAEIDRKNRAHYFDPHTVFPRHYQVPAHLPHATKESIALLAQKAHQALSLRHISEAEFVLGRRGPVLLGLHAHPGLHTHTALPNLLESVGASPREYAEHLVCLAQTRS